MPSMYLVPLGRSEFDRLLATAPFKIELLDPLYTDIAFECLRNSYPLLVLHAIPHVRSVFMDISTFPTVSSSPVGL